MRRLPSPIVLSRPCHSLSSSFQVLVSKPDLQAPTFGCLSHSPTVPCHNVVALFHFWFQFLNQLPFQSRAWADQSLPASRRGAVRCAGAGLSGLQLVLLVLFSSTVICSCFQWMGQGSQEEFPLLFDCPCLV